MPISPDLFELYAFMQEEEDKTSQGLLLWLWHSIRPPRAIDPTQPDDVLDSAATMAQELHALFSASERL